MYEIREENRKISKLYHPISRKWKVWEHLPVLSTSQRYWATQGSIFNCVILITIHWLWNNWGTLKEIPVRHPSNTLLSDILLTVDCDYMPRALKGLLVVLWLHIQEVLRPSSEKQWCPLSAPRNRYCLGLFRLRYSLCC